MKMSIMSIIVILLLLITIGFIEKRSFNRFIEARVTTVSDAGSIMLYGNGFKFFISNDIGDGENEVIILNNPNIIPSDAKYVLNFDVNYRGSVNLSKYDSYRECIYNFNTIGNYAIYLSKYDNPRFYIVYCGGIYGTNDYIK